MIAETSVLHLDHSLAPGGAELALRRLLMAEPPWHGTLFVPRGAGTNLGVFEPLQGERLGVVLRRVGPAQPPGASGKMSVGSLLRFGGGIAAQVVSVVLRRSARRADLIHANTSRSAIYGAVAARLLRKRFVLHLRDFVDPGVLGRFGWWTLTRLALPSADGVIANSASTLATAQPWIRAGVPAVIIPSPIGVISRQGASFPESPVEVIGMVARISPWKGHDLLLRAFAAEFRGTPVRLAFAGGVSFGEDAHLQQLQAMAQELGVLAQVDFLGHVEDVSAVLSGFDICVHASTREEPLGQTVLQYLAAGRPTVAVNAGGPAEWVQHGVNGLLVPMNDHVALSAALRTLVDTPELRSRIALGARTDTRILEDPTIANMHGHLFDQVASLPRRNGRTGWWTRAPHWFRG